MRTSWKIRLLFATCGLLLTGICASVYAEDVPQPILTRIFYQDDESKTLKWADLHRGTPPTLGKVQEIANFPKLDNAKQGLVQMGAVDGWILVGVRDEEDGKFQSGWVLIDTGVEIEEHDDHSHTHYERAPAVRASQLDDKQGNPAHLYVYDKAFYVANDKLDGYTRINPSLIQEKDDAAAIQAKAEFFSGGGGHITLAAANKLVGYSTWADRKGDNQGRVDVTALTSGGRKTSNYSFKLPHGGLHGATASEDKIFFAPSDGICWVTADPKLSLKPEDVKVQHISLGKESEGDKPLRTGAFANWGKHVLFVTGSGPEAALWSMDASSSTVTPNTLKLDLAKGNRPSTPEVVVPRKGGSPLAFVFHSHAKDVEAPNAVSLVEIDPNQDGNFTDAKVASVIEVGPCHVDGHAGHHEVAFDGDRRYGLLTNSGDGTLMAISLAERKSIQKYSVGGKPSKILAIGARETND